jgi:hypothetical protein
VLTLFVIRLKHVTHPLLGNGGPLPLSLRRLFLFHFFFQALLSYGHQLTHTHRCEPFLLYLQVQAIPWAPLPVAPGLGPLICACFFRLFRRQMGAVCLSI